MRLGFTYFRRLVEPTGRRVSTTWEKLTARLAVERVVPIKETAPGISLATYAGDRRAIANVERVYAVGLDLDENVDWRKLCARFASVASFLHTTWSSTKADPRARVFLPLSRPVTGDEYKLVYASVAKVAEAGGLVVDRKASDPSRFWFLPSRPPRGAYACSVGAGAPISVDWALRVAPRPEPFQAPAPLRGDGVATPTTEARAAAYLEKCAPAVSGSGGHNTTFLVAQKLVRGFALDEETAFRLLCRWNEGCQPPWSEGQLRRKVRQAAEHGRMQEGALRDVRKAS